MHTPWRWRPGRGAGGCQGASGAVSAAPWGSASILPIAYLYIRLMGAAGLRHASEIAILSANYVAKRLIDFGFHAPTMSFPVPGTLMIEPTESECKHELDRFCDAMLAIRDEIRAIERGQWTIAESPLRHAPHTVKDLARAGWDRPYTRGQGCLPPGVDAAQKYWSPVGRIDDAYGDRNLICSCPAIQDCAT